MYDNLTLPELDGLVTAEQAQELDTATTFTLSRALRWAADCGEIQQATHSFGNGETTACALSASILVAERLGYLA